MMNAKNKTIEDMNNKLQSSRGKKLKFQQNISKYYDQTKYMRQSYTLQIEDAFSKNAQRIVFIMHEALLLMKLLQTKHKAEKMKITYYDLY